MVKVKVAAAVVVGGCVGGSHRNTLARIAVTCAVHMTCALLDRCGQQLEAL